MQSHPEPPYIPRYRHLVSRRIAWTAATVATLGFVSLGFAGEARRPSAASILDRFIEVTGGKAAYDKIRNRVTTGRIVHVGMGFEDATISYAARPNKRYHRWNSEAMGVVENGTNGTIAWYLSDPTGAIIEDGAVREGTLHDSTFDGLARWREIYEKVEVVGDEIVDDQSCFVVTMKPHAAAPETWYFGKKSGLAVKATKSRLFTNMPVIPFELRFSDYKRVDGILLPHSVRKVSVQCGTKREMLVVTDSIRHNVELSADRFDPPAAIKSAALASGGGNQPGKMNSGPKGTMGGVGRVKPCGAPSRKTKD